MSAEDFNNRGKLGLFSAGKSKRRFVGVGFSCGKRRGGKSRIIDGVRVKMGLQAETVMRTVCAAALSDASGIQVVAGVEMDPRQRGVNLHGDSGPGGACGSGGAKDTPGTVDGIIMVISPGLLQLGIGIADVCLDRDHFPQIHGSSCHQKVSAPHRRGCSGQRISEFADPSHSRCCGRPN